MRSSASTLSLLSGNGQGHNDAIQTGKSYFVFDLSAGPSQLVTGGAPRLYIAKSLTSKPLGPFTATWSLLSGYQKTGDTSPRSPIPGVYWAQVEIPSSGIWTFAAVAENGGRRGVGIGHAYVSDHVVAAVGSKAISVPTPVATTPAAIRKISTRNPPDPMHYISLDKALTNGKPTVVSFATPLFCTSRLCGPVVDEQLLLFQRSEKPKRTSSSSRSSRPGTCRCSRRRSARGGSRRNRG